MDTVIRTEGLTRHFGGRAVVDRLNLEVPKGAIYALLGDNGAGKSTTIRMLMGLLQPDAGKAEVLGENCWTSAIQLRHRVGYVPEKPRFYDWMTVKEIGWFTAGFHRPGFLRRYQELVSHFGLDAAAKLKTLSKGGYAKVGLALALASEPEVLILDEPTSGLDLFTRREFLSSMVELAGEGRTILLSSHGVAEVERVASHAAFISSGKLLLAAPLEDLRKRLVRVRVRFRERPTEIQGLGTLLEQERSGRQWEGIIQDPQTEVLSELRHRDGITDLEELPISLEEMYTAVLGRFHGSGQPGSNGKPSAGSSAPVP
jgi:ABC-2 type transport system ATP-binding protein